MNVVQLLAGDIKRLTLFEDTPTDQSPLVFNSSTDGNFFSDLSADGVTDQRNLDLLFFDTIN